MRLPQTALRMRNDLSFFDHNVFAPRLVVPLLTHVKLGGQLLDTVGCHTSDIVPCAAGFFQAGDGGQGGALHRRC
jgi:hypothetical protein